MKKIIIKELKEIEQIKDDNFEFKVIIDGSILVKSKHTGMVIMRLPVNYAYQLEDFKSFGYDIRILKKTTLEILEEVADINCADLIRCKKTKRWYLRRFNDELVKHIEPYLEKEGYYL